ncbi:MAG: Gx transporter family protein [candidate division KSB1 bacterium]|nr:Gx transporter family protein [candidate division KSB1 bacterium]
MSAPGVRAERRESPAGRARTVALLSLLVAVGSVLSLFESLLPRPLPWAKPGLANLVTLVALDRLGFAMASMVALGRVLVAALLTGSLANLPFAFSVAGAVLALLVMGAVERWASPPFGVVGISLFGAVAHACGQLIVAWALLVRSQAVLALVPSFGLTAAAAGLVVGVAASILREPLHKLTPPLLTS